jgi:hypothetical protein
MCYPPTPVEGLVVGRGYYALDRMADPTEVVTLVSLGGPAVVRGRSGAERVVPPDWLSAVPPDEYYRGLRRSPCPGV